MLKPHFLPEWTSALSTALLFVVVCSFFSDSRALAQTGTTSLGVVVSDPSGALIPGAQVTIANPAIGLNSVMVASRHGELQFPNLPPGSYTVTATTNGFSSTTREGMELLVDIQPASLSLNRTEQIEPPGSQCSFAALFLYVSH